jgi:nickel/cobalt exporter
MLKDKTFILKILIVLVMFISITENIILANPFTNQSSKNDLNPVRTNISNKDSVKKQMNLRNTLAIHLTSWKNNSSSSLLWAILLTAFLYGIFHAMGPGHRKTIVFSMYIARKAPPWEPALTGFLLALFHGGTSVILLLILKSTAGAISTKADKIAIYMEGAAYSILIITALILIIYSIIKFIKKNNVTKNSTIPQNTMGLSALLITGFYPCPGAVLILILALTQNILMIGIIAVMIMSAGMAIPIIASGYLAWAGRTGIFLGLKKNQHKIEKAASIIELAGYSLLLIFTSYIASPFLVSLFRSL